MNDVAREADVGLKTVSRFVNGATNIDPVLAERIGGAIERLGYRRNLAAASIRPGWTSRVIGLVISDLANPYYSTLARAIESVVTAAGYLLITASSEEDGVRHDRFVDRLMGQQVDAIISVPPRAAARSWSAVPPPLPPLVFIDRPDPFPDADVVIADNRGGSAEATALLLQAGARRVAFVGDSLSIYTMAERHRGYLDAYGAAGAAVDESLLFTTAHSSDEAAALVSHVLERGSADAIFAANNRASIGALLAFRRSGQRLPIIGFDDFEAARLSDPGFSVVSQDIEQMGRSAAEAALARIAGDHSPFARRILPARLVLRGSELPS